MISHLARSRRPIDLLKAACALALLQTSSAHAQTIWTNATADGLWNTGGNWSLGVPGAGNNALFSGPAPGVVSLGNSPSGSAMMNLSFSAGDYTISSGGATGSLTFANLDHAVGTNAISAPVISTGTSVISGGVLTLSNTSLAGANNFTGTTIEVGAGGTLNALFGGVRPGVAGPSGSSSIAGAHVALGGGTLILGGNTYDAGTGGLTGQYYVQESSRTARPEFQTLGGITALFNTSTPELLAAPNAGFTNAISNIDFSNTNYGALAPFSSVGVTALDNVMATWKGKFIAPSAGTYTFGGNSDDGLMVYVNGTLLFERNNFQGAAPNPPAGTISLPAGAHDIYVAYYEGSGGAGVRVYSNDPATDAAGVPLALTELSAAQPFTVLGNHMTLNASSTIAPENTYGVGLGILSAITPGVTLTTGRVGRMDGYVRFNATNFGPSGTYNVETVSDLGLGLISDGGNTITLTKTGNGNLILDTPAPAAATDGMTIDVQAGRLVVSRTNTGDSPLGSATVQLNGAGTVLQLNLVESNGGNTTFDTAIQVTQNARIESTNHSLIPREVIIGSAARGISIAAGRTLSFWAPDNVSTRINGVISGAGDILFTAQNDVGFLQGLHFLNAANTFTGKTIIENSAHLRIDHAAALDSSSAIDVGAGGRIEFFGNNSFNSATARFLGRPGSLIRLSGPTVANTGTLEVAAGRILELQSLAASTGGATVLHAPNSYFSITAVNSVPFLATTTQVGLRAADLRPLDVIRASSTINGAGDGVVNAGWGATPVGTILQLSTIDRNVTNSAIQELNGQIITNDGMNRAMIDGNRLDVGSLGGTIAASGAGVLTILTVNENILTDANSGKLTIGSHIPLDGRISNGTVVFANAAAGDFTGTTASSAKSVNVINGSILEGRVSAAGVSGLGATAGTAIGVSLDRGFLRAVQPTPTVNGGFLNVGKVFATGAATLAVNRGTTAGNVTEMRLNARIDRSAGSTISLLGTNNSLGIDERIRFANLADAPARVGSMNMVAPHFINAGANVGSFVDYDPAQDPATGIGFSNASYTAVANVAALNGTGTTTIADITAAVAMTESRTVGAARIQGNLSGGFTLTSQTGGFIVTSNAAANHTVAAGLAAPAGTEFVVFAGGATSGTHTFNGFITSDSGLTKFGPRVLVMGANNSATLFGDITVNDSSLLFFNNNALGDPSNRIVLNGGNVRVANNMTIGREIVVNGGGTSFINDGNRDLTLTGVISGKGSFTLGSTAGNNGITRLQQATANPFSSGLIVTNGTLEFSRNDQLGAAPSATDYDSGHIAIIESLTSNATLRLAAGAGNVTTTGRQFTLLGNAKIEVADNDDTLEIDADIRGTGALNKTGPGTLILSNSLGNGYTGLTTVSGGALLANNSFFSATGTEAVSIASGAILGGDGIIEGSITGSTGSILSPGASLDAGATGILRGQNGLTLQDNAVFRWSLAAESTTNPGTNYDRFVLDNGALAITNGANLTLDFATGVAPSANAFWENDHVWSDIFQVTSLGTIGTAGTFDIDNTLWASFGTFSTVSDSNGYDLVWTTVPEPGSALLLVGGLALIASGRRRRSA
jgi:fibronectin-binding autotransporter adhesin